MLWEVNSIVRWSLLKPEPVNFIIMSEVAGIESSILKLYSAILFVQDVNNLHQIINKIVEDW